MGNQEDQTSKSDSGYGDDAPPAALDETNKNHPLALKGYDVATASTLQVGDVFEFLWADAHEYQWEWKCLGYTRFIVLRHTDTFPHYAACIPVSVGGRGMSDFTKPGIDHLQQGFVFAEGDKNPGVRQPKSGIPLPYSPIGIELKAGKLRVPNDSRANYADIVEVDHDAEIMVVGRVNRYFDRLRRNVNRAVMRQILRKSLEEYCERKARGSTLDLRSKTVESNPNKFQSLGLGPGFVEERSEDELPPDTNEQPKSPTVADRSASDTDRRSKRPPPRKPKPTSVGSAGSGGSKTSLKEYREEARDKIEDSDEFDERQRLEHQNRQRQNRRTSRSSRSSRDLGSYERPALEEESDGKKDRPSWFRRMSSLLDKDKEREYNSDWNNYVVQAQGSRVSQHRRSNSLETENGIQVASSFSRQSSPRRRPRRHYSNEGANASRLSHDDPRSMLDMATVGRRRPTSSGE